MFIRSLSRNKIKVLQSQAGFFRPGNVKRNEKFGKEWRKGGVASETRRVDEKRSAGEGR